MFADDANIFISGNNVNELKFTANVCLKEINTWCNANKVCINIDKTCYMIFHKTHQKYLIPQTLDICLNDITIARTTTVKFLGVLLDENLSWKNYIDMVCNKLRDMYKHFI
jgi:hypothetical protein